MKHLNKKAFLATLTLAGMLLMSATAADAPKTTPTPAKAQALKIGVVNFKSCVENSKAGKEEQANFEKLKNQMESVLGEKEKTLTEMAGKLEDPDYLDSLSPEAETELKRKFRALSGEMGQLQQQYMQTLQQNNYKVVQKLTEMVVKKSEEIAKKEGLDIILNEEAAFYYGPAYDYSAKITAMLDQEYDNGDKKIAQ